MKFICILVTHLLFFSSCTESTFRGQTQQNENLSANQAGVTSSTNIETQVSPRAECTGNVVATQLETTFDILFVLDVSGSMKDNLTTVTSGVNQFAKEFSDSKMRLGLLTFTDDFQLDVPLVNTQEFASRSATLVGHVAESIGADAQEAGLDAISLGLEHFVDDINQNKNRADATKVLLYVTDEVAYGNRFRSDLSVETTSKKLAQIKLHAKNFIFAHSTSAAISKASSVLLMSYPFQSANSQIRELGKSANIQTIELPFPFNRSTLADKFRESARIEGVSSENCK